MAPATVARLVGGRAFLMIRGTPLSHHRGMKFSPRTHPFTTKTADFVETAHLNHKARFNAKLGSLLDGLHQSIVLSDPTATWIVAFCKLPVACHDMRWKTSSPRRTRLVERFHLVKRQWVPPCGVQNQRQASQD